MLRTPVAALLTALLLVAAAPAEAGPAPLKTRVEKYSHLFLTGHGSQAWLILSTRCQGQITQTRLQRISNQAKTIYGPLRIRSYSEDIDGSRAHVTYTYAVRPLNQRNQPWVLQRNGWRYDQC